MHPRRSCAALVACQLGAGSVGCARTPEPASAPDAAHFSDTRGVEADVPGADQACLRVLQDKGVAYQRASAAGGMRTPVEIAGPIGEVALVSRGRRPPLMDCVLARALLRAGGVFQELGIAAVTFSAAFDHRTRRGSSEPSAHAYGLAIDVHSVRGPFGEYDVRKHFEPGIGTWRGLGRGPDAPGACIGTPATTEGKLLRRLACGLKLHPAFRVIVSPDDNSDHRDHLHIEASADFFPPPPGAPGLPPPPAQTSGGAAAQRPGAPSNQRGNARSRRAAKQESRARKQQKAKAKANANAKAKAKAKARTKAKARATPKAGHPT